MFGQISTGQYLRLLGLADWLRDIGAQDLSHRLKDQFWTDDETYHRTQDDLVVLMNEVLDETAQ